MKINAIVCAAALVLTSCLIAAAQTPPAPSDEHPSLPAGSGRDLMIRVCSQCHSPDNAASQELDLAGWKSLVDQMAGRGAEATDEEFDQIVHYLANAFPPLK